MPALTAIGNNRIFMQTCLTEDQEEEFKYFV